MNLAEFWNETWTTALVNHLWQSTAVAGVAWLLAIALRKNQARTRYWIWMAASVKFLVPFAAFVVAGEWLRSLVTVLPVRPAFAAVMQDVAQPFAQAETFDAAGASVAVHHAEFLPLVLLAVWAFGVAIVLMRWSRGWLVVCAALRAATPIELGADVPAFSTSTAIEPGIFGIFRPLLLVPEGILGRLTPTQLAAIVAHEMCHVRRRDNLTFALHMIAEALFWFHPAVWWIGVRLIEERERACDEVVVQQGGSAESYAEGLLNVCRFCVESPLACVAGVTGADLKKRIVRTMAEQLGRRLSLGTKLVLGMAGTLALIMPLMLGVVRAQSDSQSAAGLAKDPSDATKLPEYEIVSIKPYKDEGMRIRMGSTDTPNGFTAGGVPLQMLVRQAFGLSDSQILNEPDWTKSTRYDIQAKIAPEDALKFSRLTEAQEGRMLLPVLEERCGLKFHHETRVLTVYMLEIAKGGVKMQLVKPATGQTTAGSASAGMRIGPNGLTMAGRGATMASLSSMISMQIGNMVTDKTGLTGSYNYTLQFAPGENMLAGMLLPSSSSSAPQPEAQGPSIFAALKEQLGLNLEPTKKLVDVVVIGHIERPSPD